MPDSLTLGVAGVVLAIAVVVLAGRFRRVTIYEYQVGLRYRNGRFVDRLQAGTHWIFLPSDAVKILDARASAPVVPGQELVTSDGITVKISLAVQQRIADPVVAMHSVDNYIVATYTAVQVALREAVGSMTIDDVLARRDEIGDEVLRRSIEVARAVGVDLLSIDVKDLMLPPASKKLFAQVVEARQRGLAALEKARGETAALRSLANAARMVEANPSLLQLRLLQQLESTSGNTVILGMPANSTPVPVRQVAPVTETSVGDGRQPGAEPDSDH
jgi:regulator of protease activity HflC (stomatin/prohibitin superfamily)